MQENICNINPSYLYDDIMYDQLILASGGVLDFAIEIELLYVFPLFVFTLKID